MVSAAQVQAAIRQQAGSTRDPQHVAIINAFTGACVRWLLRRCALRDTAAWGRHTASTYACGLAAACSRRSWQPLRARVDTRCQRDVGVTATHGLSHTTPHHHTARITQCRACATTPSTSGWWRTATAPSRCSPQAT
jgi:hypothetical protein